jgi:NADH:ubiquinone oxidoreductase subunit E
MTLQTNNPAESGTSGETTGATVVEITICMGSSCFSRGNNRTLAVLKDYIERNNLGERVSLKGSLCEGRCKQGPNLIVDGAPYDQVDWSTVIDILEYHLKGDSGG